MNMICLPQYIKQMWFNQSKNGFVQKIVYEVWCLCARQSGLQSSIHLLLWCYVAHSCHQLDGQEHLGEDKGQQYLEGRVPVVIIL